MRLIATAVVLAIVAPHLAQAQSLQFTSKGSDQPITVTAEQGLEWRQETKEFVARGNAKAVQDDTQVTADTLVAHYRPKPKPANAPQKAAATDATPQAADDSSGSEVYRVDAVGHVTIKTKDEVATGEAAVYDFDHKVLVLNGQTVNLVASDGTVTAHRTLQYWSNDNVAVAEGDAVAVDTTPQGAGRKIRGDKLTAFFRDKPATGPKGKTASDKAKGRDLIYLQGVGNVVLTTKSEVVHGDRGNYNLDNGEVSVDGNCPTCVKMAQGNNIVTGGYAAGNVHGTIIIYPNAAAAKGKGAAPPGRVRALLAPKSKDEAPVPEKSH